MPSLGRWKIPQTRIGRRSISVHKMLEKERLGTLFHKHSTPRRQVRDVGKVVTEEWIGRLAERRGENKDGTLKHAYELEGETNFQGLDIAIENDVGSVRKGKNEDGTPWRTVFHTPYGYIRGTTGADGEPIDCYVGPNEDSTRVFVARQKNDDRSHDEDTVMLGFDSAAAAKKDILAHYDDPKHIGEVASVSMKVLQKAVDSGKKIDKLGFATKDPEFSDPAAENEVGLPAPPRRRRGDVPSRDEVELNPTPKVESRGNNMETHLIGEFHSPGGNDDLGKFGASVSEQGSVGEDWAGDPDIGLSLATAREDEPRVPFDVISQLGAIEDDQRTERPTEKAAAMQRAFLDELVKIAEENGIPPWVGELDDFAGYAEGFRKVAFGGAVAQGVRNVVGKLRPASAAGALSPEVKAFRQGTGFFSTGIGQGLHAGGKMLAHNPQTAGRAAGLGAKDLGALQAMKPTSAGRRIAGETAIGAGHHMQHAGPGLMAMNPVGVPMGGAIEGFTRGVGKELTGVGHKGVQSAGRAMVRHAPKVGFGGEFLAGAALGTPGLGALAGHHLAPAAHGLLQHTLGAGVQEASMAAPRVLPRVGGALGQAAMGLKARAGHWGGRLVGA